MQLQVRRGRSPELDELAQQRREEIVSRALLFHHCLRRYRGIGEVSGSIETRIERLSLDNGNCVARQRRFTLRGDAPSLCVVPVRERDVAVLVAGQQEGLVNEIAALPHGGKRGPL